MNGPVPTGWAPMSLPYVCLDHLARHGTGVGHRQDVKETKIRKFQVDFQSVAVDDLEAGDRRVVMKLAVLRGFLPRFVAMDELGWLRASTATATCARPARLLASCRDAS